MKSHHFYLSLLLVITSCASVAEDDTGLQHSITFAQSYSFDFESVGYGAEYEMKPWQDLGLTFLVGVDYARELQYENRGMDWKHHLTVLTYGLGYQYQASDTFSVALKAGGTTSMSDQTDSQVLMGDTSGFVNFEMAYQVFHGFEVVNRFVHDFGHENLPRHSSFGLGLRYWFGSRSDNNDISDSDASGMEARQQLAEQNLSSETQFGSIVPEQPVLQEQMSEQGNAIEVLESQEAVEQDDADQVAALPQPVPEVFKPFFSIQIGSFSKLASMNAFLRSKKIDAEEVITRTVSGMTKVSLGKFDSKVTANRYMKELKSRGVNGFVTWISKKPDSM